MKKENKEREKREMKQRQIQKKVNKEANFNDSKFVYSYSLVIHIIHKVQRTDEDNFFTLLTLLQIMIIAEVTVIGFFFHF